MTRSLAYYLQACIVCIFAFLFLVPFVLDPAISTIMHEFTEEPVVCKVNNITIKKGKSQCNWSSCREGCTATIYTCFQVTTTKLAVREVFPQLNRCCNE